MQRAQGADAVRALTALQIYLGAFADFYLLPAWAWLHRIAYRVALVAAMAL